MEARDRYLASAKDNSLEEVHSILTKDLTIRKLSVRWVAMHLIIDQRHTKRTLSRAYPNILTTDTKMSLQRIVTMHETWFHNPRGKTTVLSMDAPWFNTRKRQSLFYHMQRLWHREQTIHDTFSLSQLRLTKYSLALVHIYLICTKPLWCTARCAF